MRILIFSVVAVAGLTVYGISEEKSSDEVISNTEQIFENINEEHTDPIVTGISISKEHLEKWQKRNRENAKCKGCFDIIQPYPDDEI